MASWFDASAFSKVFFCSVSRSTPVCQIKDLTAGMTVPLGKLVGKLLHADLELGEENLPCVVCDRHLLVEGAFEQRFEVEQDRPRFAFGAVRIAALAGHELMLFRRTAWADLRRGMPGCCCHAFEYWIGPGRIDSLTAQ